MSESWDFWAASPEIPPRNMAWDEWLHKSAHSRGTPVFRSYDWSEPAATFGYFQRYQEVAAMTQLRPLLRRPTGGGLVLHDGDWTYSLSIPPGHPWHALRATDSYERMHRWIAGAFSLLGVRTDLAPCCRKETLGQCFAGYERFDVLEAGVKVAGAAQRRNQSGLLIQGSIRPPSNKNRSAWEESMRRWGQREWGVIWHSFQPQPEDESGVDLLMESRYGTTPFHQQR